MNPFQTVRSSCVLDCKDSALCFVDSWDSTIQPYIVLNSFSALHSLTTLLRMLSVSLAGHGWSHRSFQFSSCIFDNFWTLFVKLRFFICPSLLFTILSGFTNFRPYFWGCRLNLCQSPPRPHVSFWRLLFQWSEFCESSPRIWQRLACIDIPVIVNLLFLHDVQISVSRPCYINVFLSNRECFFLRHTELYSWFSVMTIDEVTLDRPKVAPELQRHLWVALVETLPIHLELLHWDFHSWQFCCSICEWENECTIFWLSSPSFAYERPWSTT